MSDQLHVVRLEDIMNNLQRPRTLEDAFVGLHKNDIAIQAIKNVMTSMSERIHRLETKGQDA